MDRLSPEAAVTMVRSRDFNWLPDDDDDKQEDVAADEIGKDSNTSTATDAKMNNNDKDKEKEKDKDQNSYSYSYSYSSGGRPTLKETEVSVGDGPNRREPWYVIRITQITQPLELVPCIRLIEES